MCHTSPEEFPDDKLDFLFASNTTCIALLVLEVYVALSTYIQFSICRRHENSLRTAGTLEQYAVLAVPCGRVPVMLWYLALSID